MQTEYIPSGDHYVAVAEKKLLKVLLGSCVGVAIFDQKSGVGGVIHLLLPEPASPDSSWSPGSYASSGLPLFIHKLLQAGAKEENLRAVIAGGALFGRISQHDIALNLGGRCIEKVHAVLRDLLIPIIKEESCGFSPSILTLDTASWHYEITTRFESPAGSRVPHRPGPGDMADAIRAITPIPQAALKIINLISEGDYDTGEIVHTIETDQVLAAKILSLCNSALFGIKRQIDSLEEAVLILGEGHLLQMMATASVDSLLAERQGVGYAMLKGGLYKHALGVAHAAKLIAQDTGLAPPGVAYTAGLLHDIGKVVLDRYFVSFQPLFYQNEEHEGNDLIDLERHLLGADHQQAGLLLATDWGLPASIAQVISHHHYPERANSHLELVHLVHVADLLTSWYLTGMEVERINSAGLRSRLDFLRLTASQLPNLIERVPWKTIQYL